MKILFSLAAILLFFPAIMGLIICWVSAFYGGADFQVCAVNIGVLYVSISLLWACLIGAILVIDRTLNS